MWSSHAAFEEAIIQDVETLLMVTSQWLSTKPTPLFASTLYPFMFTMDNHLI